MGSADARTSLYNRQSARMVSVARRPYQEAYVHAVFRSTSLPQEHRRSARTAGTAPCAGVTPTDQWAEAISALAVQPGPVTTKLCKMATLFTEGAFRPK
jgi:hypothetical protein